MTPHVHSLFHDMFNATATPMGMKLVFSGSADPKTFRLRTANSRKGVGRVRLEPSVVVSWSTHIIGGLKTCFALGCDCSPCVHCRLSRPIVLLEGKAAAFW